MDDDERLKEWRSLLRPKTMKFVGAVYIEVPGAAEVLASGHPWKVFRPADQAIDVLAELDRVRRESSEASDAG